MNNFDQQSLSSVYSVNDNILDRNANQGKNKKVNQSQFEIKLT